MEFRIAKAARVTGEMLERLVREALVAKRILEPDCVVCYGVGYRGPVPAINSNCSLMNKMEQGLRLRANLGNEALAVWPAAEMVPQDSRKLLVTPVVGRRVKHSKGTDMRVCRTGHEVVVALRKERAFFTPIVESDTEYRAWVYRKRILCVYEKRLTEPEKNVKFGRNRANGWTFHALDSANIPESVRRVAVAAVRCLDLDFGAVDILGKLKDGAIEATVLEVNSAPGVSDEHRSGIVKLVHRIVKWVEAGCPGREA